MSVHLHDLVVFVEMMSVRTMWVRVSQSCMSMPVPVADTRGDGIIVNMLVVFVMNVNVIMFQRIMRVLVYMQFGQMQPKADSHERTRKQQRQCHGLPHGHRQKSAKEWGDREIGAGASAAEVP